MRFTTTDTGAGSVVVGAWVVVGARVVVGAGGGVEGGAVVAVVGGAAVVDVTVVSGVVELGESATVDPAPGDALHAARDMNPPRSVAAAV
ncbi:MAG: hypothetical protein ACXIVQ_09325 [Acidimicrobiales bacterium]